MPEELENDTQVTDPEDGDGAPSEPSDDDEKGKPKKPLNKDKMFGMARKLKQGLPADGSAFDDDADIAVATAGMRSGIEKAVEAGDLLGFFQKYAQYYDGPPEKVEALIANLDSADSADANRKINLVGDVFREIHGNARAEIKDKLIEEFWPQKYPKAAQAGKTVNDLKSAIKKNKKSTKYQFDEEFRQKVDRAESSLQTFLHEFIEEKMKGNPEAKELDKDYTLAVAGRGAAKAHAFNLTASTYGGEDSAKLVGKVKQNMIPLTEPGSDEPIGFKRIAPPEYVPKEYSAVAPTQKWAAKAGRSDASVAAELKAKIDKLQSKSYLSPAQKQELHDLKYRHAKLTTAKAGPIIRKAAKESLDRFLDFVNEIASGDRKPQWWDDL